MRALLLVLAAGCTAPSGPAITSLASAPRQAPLPLRAATSLRVMSYNVNFGLAGDPEGVAAIAKAAPQVVFLQETNDDWRDAILGGLPGYPHHAFAPPTDLPAGGMGVLSMYPIVSLEQLPPPNRESPFFAWRAVIAAPAGRIQVLALHLRPPMSDGGSWVVGYFSTREDRERELERHAAHLDRTMPTIILGDFNEEDGGLALALATRLGFTDAIAQFTRTRTWEWPAGPLTLRFQLDHVMYDGRFTAQAAGVVEAGRSDHKPVWADLELVDPRDL